MSDFKYFWCKKSMGSSPTRIILNMDHVSAIRYLQDDDNYFMVDMADGSSYYFTREELESLMRGLGNADNRLFDEDGNRL